MLLYALPAPAQQLPDKIRGYKVYKADIRLETSAPNAKSSNKPPSAVVALDEPKVASFGLTGLTFEIGGEITPSAQSGKIDRVTFRDMRVNGLAVTPDDYEHAFEMRKGSNTKLPAPIRIFVPVTSAVKAGFNELVRKTDTWRVTGTVFVFGRFKRFGFTFKRVIPVQLDLTIKNPAISAFGD